MTSEAAISVVRELPGLAACAFRNSDGVLTVELISNALTKEQWQQLALKTLLNSDELAHSGVKASIFTWQFDSAHLTCGLGAGRTGVVLLADNRRDQALARQLAIKQAINLLG